MLLYLIRHGQTEANRNRTFQGTTDFPLNETGDQQAARIADYLKTEPIHTIYTSSMLRARQTATPLAEAMGIVPQPLDAFREVDCGRWEGVAFEQVLTAEPELLGNWLTDPETAAPEGESLASVYRRVETPLQQIIDRHRGNGAVAIVAHGAVNRALICHLLGVNPDRAFRFDQQNGCINCFDFQHTYPPKLTSCNFTAHLGG